MIPSPSNDKHRITKRLTLLFVMAASVFILTLFFKGGLDYCSRASVLSHNEDSSSFTRADLTTQALYYVSKNYYDPARFNPHQMLKGGLMAMARSVPEIVVDFPENTARIGIAVENEEKKFTLPVLKTDLAPLVPFLQDVYAFIEKNYKGETEHADIERTTINGMLETLDPHSSLLPPKIFKEFQTQTEGEFGGLGIVIGLKDGDLTVVSPLEGTPAWKAGIKAKDKILKINTEATVNMNLNEAVEKLRGKVGSQVVLSISREGVSEPFEVTLARAIIKIDSIQSKLLTSNEGDVGYIKIKSFQEDTYRELVRHLQKIKTQSKSFKGLVLDLRNNPGGLLSQAIQVSDLFLNQGVIVSTVGAENKVREIEEARSLGTEANYPIVVLMNESSASASEIVAGALRNNNRAIILGQQSFGKGSVQTVFKLRDDSALKLTIAEYLTPGNESIQTIGITPDIQLIASSVTSKAVHILEANGFREKDLEKHLDSNLNKARKSVYQIRYFQPKKESAPPESMKDKNKEDREEEPEDYSNELKLDQDYYSQLAKKILLSNPPAERETMLKALEPIAKVSSQEEEQKIIAALTEIGTDWSYGKTAEAPQAQISFGIEGKNPDQPLLAGQEEKLTLTVKNTSKGDFYRLIAKTESENPVFKNREFVFGHLRSGESKSWSTTVKIPEFALSREDEIKFVFKEANEQIPNPFTATLTTQPKPRPSFAYSYEWEGNSPALKKGSKGNLLVKVTNLGPGKAKEATINLKNLEGEGIYISKGREKLGEMEPGSTRVAHLAFQIEPSFAKNKASLEISILDISAQEGISEKIHLNLKEGTSSVPTAKLQTPPQIQLTGIDGAKSSKINRFYVSGVASSDIPLKDVMIFVGENKVYLKSANSDSKQKIPFSAQVPLEDKNNLITVIARDQYELSNHKSFYILKK